MKCVRCGEEFSMEDLEENQISPTCPNCQDDYVNDFFDEMNSPGPTDKEIPD